MYVQVCKCAVLRIKCVVWANNRATFADLTSFLPLIVSQQRFLIFDLLPDSLQMYRKAYSREFLCKMQWCGDLHVLKPREHSPYEIGPDSQPVVWRDFVSVPRIHQSSI